MEATVVLLFVILSAAIAVVAILLSRRNTGDTGDEATSHYTDGLNHLLAGRKSEALEKFRATVKQDSTNVDAYIKVGDVLRELGQPERAITVHKHLTVRTGLSPKQRQQILQCLATDYQVAKQFDNALSVLDQVLHDDRAADWAREMKLGILEAQEEWELAFQVCTELGRRNGRPRKARLALYKVHEGIKCQSAEQVKDARLRFRESIKIDPEGPPGYIYLADSYKSEGSTGEALKTLKEFVKKVPDQSFLALDRIKHLMYEGGIYSEISGFYEQLLRQHPENLSLRLALAENYEKKGDYQRAIDGCQEVLQKDPGNKEARKALIRLYHNAGDDDEALRIALELIDESVREKEKMEFDLQAYWETTQQG